MKWAMVTLLAALIGAAAEAEEFAAPEPPANLEQLGSKIQRTMTLLATSTPEHRHRVRILFYGQSVTAGPWSHALAAELKAAYPNADLEIVNRAIGGYSAPALIHTAEADLYPFYPDLLIFHVYGGTKTGEQEQIIARTRARTTSEVLLWTSHFRWPQNLARDGSPDDPAAQALTRDDEERCQLLRDLAVKYGCELAEVREALRQYLEQHDLKPKDTLGDSVHPNKLGGFLIQNLVRPYLRYDPKFSREPWEKLVADIPLTDQRVEKTTGGGLKVTFEGNRLDVLAAPGPADQAGGAKVLLDGRPPSSYPELYYHSRASTAPHVWWPAVNEIGFAKPPVLEKWTARIIELDPDKNVLKYEVSGSVTGPDGQGDHTRRFVSNSGRVVIEPRMWNIFFALKYKGKPLPEDYQVTWEVKPKFVDVYQPPAADDPAREYPTTLVLGTTNARHTVELVPTGPTALKLTGFRAYRPPLAE